MADYKIEYDRKGCIGASTCAAVHEKGWVMNGDGKADLPGSAQNPQTGFFERVIPEGEVEAHRMAADGCPAQVISITNLETGQKVI